MADAPRYVELAYEGRAPWYCSGYIGLYARRANDVNGKPAYTMVDGTNRSLWHHMLNGQEAWLIGPAEGCIGTAISSLIHYGDPIREKPNKWRRGAAQQEVPYLRATALIAADDDDEVTVVATSTPEARNAEKRKHALDLELFEPKRARTPSVELETIVAKRRSLLTPDADQKVATLMQPNFEEFLANKISAAELEQRKAAARAKAEADDVRLRALDAAHAKYTAAVAARAAHEEAGEKLRAAEDAAEAELRKLLPAEAGPSGVKSE